MMWLEGYEIQHDKREYVVPYCPCQTTVLRGKVSRVAIKPDRKQQAGLMQDMCHLIAINRQKKDTSLIL